MKSIVPILVSLFLLQACSGVNSIGDERSISQQIADDNLAAEAIDTVVDLDVYSSNIRINIVPSNGYLLLIGQVDNVQTSNTIENSLSQLDGVKSIYNQLRINQPIGPIQQTQDAWITAKVKKQLASHDDVDSFKIKVVTENSEVFLIGLVTQAMSDDATNVARKVTGVKQVIRVMEIIDLTNFKVQGLSKVKVKVKKLTTKARRYTKKIIKTKDQGTSKFKNKLNSLSTKERIKTKERGTRNKQIQKTSSTPLSLRKE